MKAHIDGFVSEVKECLERKGKIIREEMLKLSEKLGHEIAALGNRDAIHALLTQEIRETR